MANTFDKIFFLNFKLTKIKKTDLFLKNESKEKNNQKPCLLKCKFKKKNCFLANNVFSTLNWFWIMNVNSDKDSLWDLIIRFYKLWPPLQWVTSLLTLVLIYWVTGYYYNKFLSQRSGWMGVKARITMIVFDLFLNFALGIYYMNYRETLIGTLMIKCPVFCSPVFWILELVCFYIYYRYNWILTKKKKVTNKTKL